ncbi:MAG: hypothetical protein RIR26_2807 [Pseudomonadota bacterium]
MPLLLIDKPEGPTSHTVVSLIKRTLKTDKAGHLGTLDPFASGLLPVLIGNTARLADEAMDGKKGYLFTIGFGSETDTLDPTGREIAQAPLPSPLSAEDLEGVLNDFRGRIQQVPPVYSALKMNGMPLYEHMRATGKLPSDIETKRREVTIHSMEVVDWSLHALTLRVVCSKGTYIRSLARDIAKALGSVGTCTRLRRECVEPWHVQDALVLGLDGHNKMVAPDATILQSRLLPPWAVAPHLPRARLDDSHKQRFISGNPIGLEKSELLTEAFPDESNKTKRDEAAGNSAKQIISCDDVLFLCEVAPLEADRILIQPRKRLT